MSIKDEIGKETANAIGQLAVKVYDDVAGPCARQIGTSLETVFRVGLSPIAIMGWGFDRSKAWLAELVEKKINDTAPEYRVSPPMNIALSTINAISASADNPDLQQLYAELLLKSMDSRTQEIVHPSYVGVLEQLSPQEALIMISFREIGENSIFIEENSEQYSKNSLTIEAQFFKHCTAIIPCTESRCNLWLENLLRLRLLVVQSFAEAEYIAADRYRESYPSIRNKEYKYVYTTEYGRGLLKACAPSESVPQR